MTNLKAKLSIALVSCVVSISCGTVTPEETYKWNTSERANFPQQRIVPQFLDSITQQGETFYQYYFIQDPEQSTKNNYDDRTILFCSGGPGRNPMYGDNNFLANLPDYRVVYFHIRGSGFSQFPESNTYDRYLRSRYVVEDMEFIRKNVLGDKPWAAVVGNSYGTVIAQQYAWAHPDKLNKLVLAAPESRHQFRVLDSNMVVSQGQQSTTVMMKQMRETDDQLRREAREKDLDTLKEILARDDLQHLQNLIGENSVSLPSYVPRVVRTILQDVDTVAGSLPILLDSYAELQKQYDRLDPKGKQEQYKNLFEYSLDFFQALRLIRDRGWVPNDNDPEHTTDLQNSVGIIITSEVLEHTKGISLTELLKSKLQLTEYTDRLCDLKLDLDKDLEQIKESGESPGAKSRNGVIFVPVSTAILPYERLYLWICRDGPKMLSAIDNTGTKRVFAVMSFYDGLDPEVLIDTSSSGAQEKSDLVSRICSRLPFNCVLLKKIGMLANETPKAWDPADFKHNKTTLIIKGAADPVVAGNAAEHIYDAALLGSKFLIEFPGIGHDLNLPATGLRTVLTEQDGSWNGCDLGGVQNEDREITNARTCLIGLFLNDTFDAKNRDQLLSAIAVELQCRVVKKNKNRVVPSIRLREGNLPYRDIPATRIECQES